MDYALLAGLIFLAALLYSTVGHGGASAYLALMGLWGLSPEVMRPSALVMNILVASIGAVRFYRAGAFSWRVFLPFAAGSIPLAFLGGTKRLDDALYLQLVAASLVVASWPLLTTTQAKLVEHARPVPVWLAVPCGAAIGLLSGLTGIGGGIFLTPLLIFTHWAETRKSSGISAAFIAVNSIAGLLGKPQSVALVPPALAVWAGAAVAGGLLGSYLGSRRITNVALRRLLGVTLLVGAAGLFRESLGRKPPAASPAAPSTPSERAQRPLDKLTERPSD